MTVKELIAILNALPSNTTVIYAHDRFIVDEVIYDDYEGTVSFAGTREFDEIEEEPDYTWKYIPDDVDETNYDPYCGCDMFEICGSIDEEW